MIKKFKLWVASLLLTRDYEIVKKLVPEMVDYQKFEDKECGCCGMNKRTVQKNYAELNVKIIRLAEENKQARLAQSG